ncbi:MAG: hypothetical protein HY226_04490 [Candidatus Vogelbacteria bacterium]|nr:hypothetical protein [Candidatus Vogelbacteria bacterium]
MSLIERLKKELSSARGVTTMGHVEYQEKCAARSLISDFQFAVARLNEDELDDLSDYDLGGVQITIH